MKHFKIIFAAGLALSLGAQANAFTMYLESSGKFFGPGKAIFSETGTSIKRFQSAQVRNLTFTGPLVGYIPMFNNGDGEPNVIAEVLQGGIVDGMTSNGILINENIDTGLHLDISDPVTGESANIMAVAVASEDTPDGSELILPDSKGNITFNPTVYADPGQPELVKKLPRIVFTTGAAPVPLSLKTQQGLPGGTDYAGSLPSGHVLIGRIGDFDHDGFMDGILVLGGNAPADLIVGRGNPLAQIRPWHSDIPISPPQAAMLTLNGTVQNYPVPLQHVLQAGNLNMGISYLTDIDANLAAALRNVHSVLISGQNIDKATYKKIKKIRGLVRSSRYTLLSASRLLENAQTDKNKGHSNYHIMHIINHKINSGFYYAADALKLLSTLPQ